MEVEENNSEAEVEANTVSEAKVEAKTVSEAKVEAKTVSEGKVEAKTVSEANTEEEYPKGTKITLRKTKHKIFLYYTFQILGLPFFIIFIERLVTKPLNPQSKRMRLQ